MSTEAEGKIGRATQEHLEAIRTLLQKSRHLHIDFGVEDLAGLIQEQIFLIGQGGVPSPLLKAVVPLRRSSAKDKLWGAFCLQVEKRPPTLPITAPTKVYLRCAALTTGQSPTLRIGQFMAAAETRLARLAGAYQAVAYGNAHWLIKPLENAGFTIAERVQFWELTRLARRELLPPKPHTHLLIRPVQLHEVEAVARLDATVFPPLWHLGKAEIYELAIRSRLQVAIVDKQLVGYSALILSNTDQAQLARLAVAPTMQKQGVGTQLLTDALLHAKMEGVTLVTLNTQTTNNPAQALYRAFGFQPVSKVIPVLTKMIDL